MSKEQLLKYDIENLKTLKVKVRERILSKESEGIREELSSTMEIIDEVINEKLSKINEDGDGGGDAGGAGVAMANQGTVSGMGNVVASQPSSTPGAAFTGDGTVGSGDIGMPLGTYTKKGITGDKYTKMNFKGKKKKKKSKKDSRLMSDIADFLKKHKQGKSSGVMNYQDFMKGETTSVTKVSESNKLIKTCYIANSSWFDTHEYNKEEMVDIISNNVDNIRFVNYLGQNNLPQVVVFECQNPKEIEELLNDHYDTQWIQVQECQEGDDWCYESEPKAGSTALKSVKVKFENPEYNYTTSVNPGSTEEELRKYFVGTEFNVAPYPKEQFEEVIDIEIIK